MIEIWDDKKGKHNSFEARISDKGCLFELFAFGSSEEDAVRNLKELVAGVRLRLGNADFSHRISVDAFRNPINEPYTVR